MGIFNFFNLFDSNSDKNNSVNSSYTIEIAHEAYKQRDYKRAIQIANDLISQNNKNALLFFFRANVNEDIGEYEAAIKDYKTGLLIQSWYSIYHQIGVNYDSLKQFEEAKHAYTKALELKEEQDNDDRITDNMPKFKYGIVWRVEYPKLYSNRAKVKLEIDDMEGTAADCIKALYANSQYSNAHFIFGLYYLKLGDTMRAIKSLTMATSLGHKKAPMLLNQLR